MLKAAGVEYETRGEGEAVLFIHAGFICDWDLPLMSQTALSNFKLIRYHRRGFGGSDPLSAQATIAGQAADAKALLDSLEVRRAHVVGHSYGGAIALQLALDAPEVVHSLVLSEPALQFILLPPPRPPATAHGGSSAPNHVQVVNAFMSNVCGTDWREVVERMVPGAAALADRDAANHALTLPALLAWQFDSDGAAAIHQPVLGVVGTASPPLAAQRRQILGDWITQMEHFDVAGANHLLPLHSQTAASSLAEGLASFFTRHPIVNQP
jgi:pimeloyl-ACP methyl ester carboxylesterase